MPDSSSLPPSAANDDSASTEKVRNVEVGQNGVGASTGEASSTRERPGNSGLRAQPSKQRSKAVSSDAGVKKSKGFDQQQLLAAGFVPSVTVAVHIVNMCVDAIDKLMISFSYQVNTVPVCFLFSALCSAIVFLLDKLRLDVRSIFFILNTMMIAHLAISVQNSNQINKEQIRQCTTFICSK